MCAWASLNTGKKICLTGGVKCLFNYTVSLSINATLVSCDGNMLKIKDITGNIEDQDINTGSWNDTGDDSGWDKATGTLTFYNYAADNHELEWSSNNNRLGFAWYNNIPIVGSVFLQNLALTNDNPPRLQIGVSTLETAGFWMYCPSNNQISTNC